MYSSLTLNETDATKYRCEMSGKYYVSFGDDDQGNKVNLLCHREVVRRMAVVCGLIEPAPVEVPDSALDEVAALQALAIKAIDEAA